VCIRRATAARLTRMARALSQMGSATRVGMGAPGIEQATAANPLKTDPPTPGPHTQARECRVNPRRLSPRPIIRALCSCASKVAEGNVARQRPLHHAEVFAEVLVHGVPAE
jgi:hypothetical protein